MPLRLRSFRFALAALLAGGVGFAAAAGPVPFDSGWTTQRFSLFSSNSYGLQGKVLTIASDASVSLIYRRLDPGNWAARRASWGWEVTEGVPATDLARKGGDDRNASLYFVFMPEAEARALGPRANIRQLLGAETARVLVYVWGDRRARGTQLSSPYLGARGKTVILRPAGTGAHRESVDLAADYARAFGGTPGALVGLAVSADSDDTKSRIRARITGLSLN
ncbi:MAG: DUF3047 domain-containing protein [Pseudorhodobacter sp.]